MISLFLGNDSDDYVTDPLTGFFFRAINRSSAGISVTDESAMTYSAVWACTRILCSGAGLPLNLFRKDGTQRVIADDHRVHRMIHSSPNPEMSSMSSRLAGINQQVNGGNYFAEIERDIQGNSQNLWPITVPVEAKRADDKIAREIGVKTNDLCWKIHNVMKPATHLADRDMFHVMSTITDNGILGKGVIKNARESIGLGIATEQQGASYMKNSARPTVVIKGGKFKTTTDREDYRQMWMDVHGGTQNNGKPALLPEGADISTMSFSPEDSQFLQTRQHNVEEICRWYGVPPHMVQHLLRATFNNIEHMGIEFVVFSLIPWLRMWEDEIWRKLLTPTEQKTMYAKHNVDALLRGDTQSRSAFYKTLWELGVISANEIREKEDWNPIGDDGDKRYVQTSYTTIESLNIGDWKSAREKNDITRDEFRKRVLDLPESVNQDDAPLLSNVGGLTGTVAVAQAVGKGEMSPDAGAELLALFLKIEAERAAKIAGEKIAQPEPVQAPQQKPPAAPNLDAREAAIKEAAKLLIRETTSRLLSRECIALNRAATKTSAEFFIWLDTFYAEHLSVMTEALTKPLEIYGLAFELNGSCPTARALAESHVKTSREQVVLRTEEWETFQSSMNALTKQWLECRELSIGGAA